MTDRTILIDIIPSDDGTFSVYAGMPGAREFFYATHDFDHDGAESVAAARSDYYAGRGFTVSVERLRMGAEPRKVQS